MQGESNSIKKQKEYLEDFARKNGFRNIRHFTDDGVSGITFERKGFQKMIVEIEAGNVDTIIVKDMSRFGRNYTDLFYMQLPDKPELSVYNFSCSKTVQKPCSNDNCPIICFIFITTLFINHRWSNLSMFIFQFACFFYIFVCLII